MTPAAAASAVTVLAVVALLVGERRRQLPLKAASKAIASCGFLAAAALHGADDTPYGRAVLAALALSLVGDLCLLSSASRWFLGGLVAFLLGHLGFAGAFVLAGVAPVGVGVGAAAVGALLPLVARWLLPHVPPPMKVPVLAYMVVISAMVALAAGLVAATGEPIFLVAAVAFFVSDLSVARERFVASSFGNKLWGLPLYYGAQLLFAASVGL